MDYSKACALGFAAAASVSAAIFGHWVFFMKNPNGLPGPTPLPFLGNILSIPATLTTQFLVDMRAKYGKNFVLWFYWRPVVFVSDVEMIRELCCGKLSDLFVRYSPHIHSFKNNGGLSTIFSANEDSHFQARMTLMKLFSRSRIEKIIPKVHEAVRTQIKEWQRLPHTAECMNNLAFRLVVNTLLFALFGVSAEVLSESSCQTLEYRDLFSAEGLFFMRIPFNFLVDIWPGQSVKPNGKIKRLILELFEKEKSRRDNQNEDMSQSLFEDMLAEAQRNPHLDFDAAVEICSELLTNATASIVRAVSQGVILLFRDQTSLRRVRMEVDALWPFSEPLESHLNYSADAASFNSWVSAGYLNRAVKEIIRIVAPSREVERCPMQDVELSFGRFSKHTQFIVPTALVGWDAELWYCPDHFNPDRFQDDSLQANLVNFGMGTRGCLGQGFSIPCINIVLGHFARHFQATLQPTAQVPVPMDGYTPVVLTARCNEADSRAAADPNACAAGPSVQSDFEPSGAAVAEAAAGRFKLLVVFATVTNNARGYAVRVNNLAKSQPLITPSLVDVAKLDPHKDIAALDKNNSALVVVCSSYGFGELPPAASGFVSWLQGEQAAHTIAGLKFAVLGLGSSYYQDSYQGGALYVDSRLEALGGSRIYPVGRLDQLVAHEDQFIEWSRGFWPALEAARGVSGSSKSAVLAPSERLEVSLSAEARAKNQGTYVNTLGRKHHISLKEAALGVFLVKGLKHSITHHGSHVDELSLAHWDKKTHAQIDVESQDPAHYILKQNPGAFEARVVKNIELQAVSDDTSTRGIELERLDRQPIGYLAGDYLTVFPQNHPRDVDFLIGHMGWDPAEIITISSTDEGRPVPDCYKSPRSILDMLKDNVDVCVRPSKLQLRTLSRFCTGGDKNTAQRDQRMLFLLGAPSEPDSHPGTVLNDLYSSWITSDGRDLNDVFRSFPSVRLNIAEYLELMDHSLLKPRLYSIASSHLSDPAVVALCVRLAEYQTCTDGMRVFTGVASDFLCGLTVGRTVPCSIKSNPHVRIPVDSSSPILLVGSGSGMSLLRSVLQSRVSQFQAACFKGEESKVGKVIMIYGCRAEDVDELYKAELVEAQAKGLLFYYPAFSQPRPHPKAAGCHGYVQNMVVEVGKQVYDALLQGAFIYVCGSKAMGVGVHRACLHVLEEHGGMSPIESAEFLSNKSRNKTYVKDIFG